MKAKKNNQGAPISGPLLDKVVALDKEHYAVNFPAPSVSEKPLASPDFYQDSGSGYNTDFVFPQD